MDDLGFDYLNLKEKCLECDEKLSKVAGESRFCLTCAKAHVHFRFAYLPLAKGFVALGLQGFRILRL